MQRRDANSRAESISGQPAGRNHTYTVAVLCAVYTLSCLDRNIINILAEEIKRDLLLADWQLGILTGIAFALFYTFLGIPLARLADKSSTNRVHLIAICVAFWSIMTGLCGLATSFLQLTLARMGVGVGEAGGGPGAHALIGDVVPPERRATAMGVYALGIPLGTLLGMSVGGVLALYFGWRAAFLLVGLPGMLVATVVWFTLREPRTEAIAHHTPAPESFMTAVRSLWSSKVFVYVTLAAALMTMLLAGQGAFLASLLIRVYGLNIGEAGVLLGAAVGTGGALGSFVGGRVVDAIAGTNIRMHMLLPIISILLGAAFFAGAILSPTPAVTVAMLFISATLTHCWFGPVFSAIQRVTQASRRATAAAVHAFCVNLFGVSTGPLLVGLLSDVLNKGFELGPLAAAALGPEEGLRYALLTLALMPVLAAFALFKASATIPYEVLDEAETFDPRRGQSGLSNGQVVSSVDER